MMRAILALSALIAGASGATLVTARAPAPAVSQPMPTGTMTTPAPPTTTTPAPTTTTGDDVGDGDEPAPATLPDTTAPAPIVPSGAVGLVRSSPTQPRVLPPSSGEPTGVPTPSQVNMTVTTAEEIANAQLMLQGLGLYKGPINGLLTGPTRAALRVFQGQARLPVTGHLDLRTADGLGLNDDGQLTDTGTIDAVEQLQVDAGLPVTGELDEATLQVLREGLIPQENGLPAVRFRDTLPMAPGSP